MKRLAARGLRWTADRLEPVQPELAGRIDWNLSSLWRWGGPLNGQAGRQEIVRQLLSRLHPTMIVETGTFHGASTGFLADVGACPVVTCEASERFYAFAARRYFRRRDVELRNADSRATLAAIAASEDYDTARLFVYLDAHWEDDLPLAEELAIIGEWFPNAVVMIDDFQVPDDPGYEFDDYGPGRRLSLHDFGQNVPSGHIVLFPALPGADEDGPRRGCVVLAPGGWYDHHVNAIPSLRQWSSDNSP